MAFPLSDRIEREGDINPYEDQNLEEEAKGSAHTTNESYSEDSLYD